MWSVIGLAGFHTFLAACNLTTNEDVSHISDFFCEYKYIYYYIYIYLHGLSGNVHFSFWKFNGMANYCRLLCTYYNCLLFIWMSLFKNKIWNTSLIIAHSNCIVIILLTQVWLMNVKLIVILVIGLSLFTINHCKPLRLFFLCAFYSHYSFF